MWHSEDKYEKGRGLHGRRGGPVEINVVKIAYGLLLAMGTKGRRVEFKFIGMVGEVNCALFGDGSYSWLVA